MCEIRYIVGIIFALICIGGICYYIKREGLPKSLLYEYGSKIKEGVIKNNLIGWPSYNKTLVVGGKRIKVAIADTYEKRARGFMYAKEVPLDSGILFVFEREDKHCFWMKNTYVKISIAFINRDWEIVEIKDMEPLNEHSVCPSVKVLYALEMSYNYFRQNNIKEKDKISLFD